MSWVTVERQVGYFGSRRDAFNAGFDGQYRAGNWRIAFEMGELTLDLAEMLQVYEDSYLLFLIANPSILELLVTEASDVYDDHPSNVASGLIYAIQQTNRNHYQDIAIRRCLRRLGRQFRGGNLLQIRHQIGTHPLSMTLSPGTVPFHLPQLVTEPITGWWEAGTVEAAYQSFKVVQRWEE
jgi:hypothetical protein